MGGPYRGKLLEFGESVLAHLPEAGQGSGNPGPTLADKGNPLGKSGLADEHLVRTDEGVVFARSVRRLAGQKKTSELLSKHHRGRRRRLRTSRLRLNLSLLLMHHKKHPRIRRKNLRQNMRKTNKCRESQWTQTKHQERRAQAEARSAQRRESVSVKKRVMMKSPKRPATPVSLLDDPV